MADDSSYAKERKRMQAEPLLPVEKRLVAWSIGIGVVLLAILVLLFRS